MKRFFSVTSIIALIETTKTSDRWLLRLVLLGVLLALIWLILSINAAVSVSDVRAGGSLEEGILGTPRFVNPVLALTRADQDVTKLVYSGLLSIDDAGNLVPDIAQGWTISDDGTVYTVTLKKDAVFHDEVPVTAADVVFTIELIQNGDLKSPLRSSWSGAEVSTIDDYTVEIKLTEPYAPFIENLTVGILPAHVWRSIPIEQVPFSEYNTTPIGSGPYEINSTDFSKNGTVSHYQLTPAAAHSPNALLSELDLLFYTNEDELVTAFEKGKVTSSAYLPSNLVRSLDKDEYSVAEVPLTRTFALFFNQNKSIALRDAAVREALELLIDRDTLINTGLGGAGIPTETAVAEMEDAVEFEGTELQPQTEGPVSLNRSEIATLVLEEAGWTESDEGVWGKRIDDELVPLSVTIRTANTPVFNTTLDALVEMWESFGVQVATEQFSQTDLVENVIREREFEILFFGIDPGRTNDLYPFWHSSQQDDPGLNVAQYTNLTVDEYLENLRTATGEEEQAASLLGINTIIKDERPAIFLFRPTLQYVTPAGLTITPPQKLSHPAERFSTVHTWYAQSRSLWPIFSNKTQENEQDLNIEN